MMINSKLEIEKFRGKSFVPWKLKMEELLVDRDQWVIVNPSIVVIGMSTKDNLELDQNTKSIILSFNFIIAKCFMENYIAGLYQSMSLMNKLLLQKKLYKLRMKDGYLVIENLNTFNIVVSHLLNVDIKI